MKQIKMTTHKYSTHRSVGPQLQNVKMDDHFYIYGVFFWQLWPDLHTMETSWLICYQNKVYLTWQYSWNSLLGHRVWCNTGVGSVWTVVMQHILMMFNIYCDSSTCLLTHEHVWTLEWIKTRGCVRGGDSTWFHHFVSRKKSCFVCFAWTDSSRQLWVM